MAQILFMMSFSGCKSAHWQKNHGEGSDGGNLVMPRKMHNSTAPASHTTDAFELDPRSGKVRTSLVLRLDYFPEPKPGKSTLPACFNPFPDDFEIGHLQCEADPTKRRSLFAKNVDQVCYTNPKFQGRGVREPASLPSCPRARAYSHQFQPELRIDHEIR
jgi:hypothetical protein